MGIGLKKRQNQSNFHKCLVINKAVSTDYAKKRTEHPNNHSILMTRWLKTPQKWKEWLNFTDWLSEEIEKEVESAIITLLTELKKIDFFHDGASSKGIRFTVIRLKKRSTHFFLL